MIAATNRLAQNLKRRARLLADIGRDKSAVALTEFAYTAPIVLSLGMMGTETAYYSITHMQISQLAMQVADNASRVGSTDVLEARQVFESDINDVFIGAHKLGGGLEFLANGRVILSSLQSYDPDPDDGVPENAQFIAWQRCKGIAPYTSSYGDEGDGAAGEPAIAGMGEPGEEIQAASGTAVMFVEVVYDYDGLTPFDDFITGDTIRYTAAFNIRDSRDLTQLYPTTGVTPATCDIYDTF